MYGNELRNGDLSSDHESDGMTARGDVGIHLLDPSGIPTIGGNPRIHLSKISEHPEDQSGISDTVRRKSNVAIMEEEKKHSVMSPFGRSKT